MHQAACLAQGISCSKASAQVPCPQAPTPCQAGHAQKPFYKRSVLSPQQLPLQLSHGSCTQQAAALLQFLVQLELTRSPSSDALSADTRTSAAAPSAMTEAFPAVTVPGWPLSPAAMQSAQSWRGLIPPRVFQQW